MREYYEVFMKWFKPDAVFWGDPDDPLYKWPMREDAPDEAVQAYKEFLAREMEAKKNGEIID